MKGFKWGCLLFAFFCFGGDVLCFCVCIVPRSNPLGNETVHNIDQIREYREYKKYDRVQVEFGGQSVNS